MYDFNKMCRTCLSSEKDGGDDGAVLTPFSGETSPKIHTGAIGVVNLIAQLTGVEINDDTRYPQNICTVCIADIERAYKFKLKCEQSDHFLRKEFGTQKPAKPRNRSRFPKCSKYKASGKEQPLREPPSSTITTGSGTTITASCYDSELGPSLAKIKRRSSEDDIVKNAFEHAFESDNDDVNNKDDSSNVQYEEVLLDIIDDKLTIVSSKLCRNIDGTEFSGVLVKNENITKDLLSVSELEDNMAEDYSFDDIDENSQLDFVKDEPQLHTNEMAGIAESDGSRRPQIVPVAGEDLSTKSDMRLLDQKCRCRACEIDLDGIIQYKQHFIEQHTRGQFCMICEKEFISNMWSHSRRHLCETNLASGSSGSSGEYKCPKCSKSYATVIGLKAHETKFHSNCMLCLHCPAEFQDREEYKKHTATHKGETDYQRCNICSKVVKAIYYHRKIHSDSRPFGCDICTHRFKSRGHLRQHLKFGHRTKCKPNCRLCKFSEELKNI